MTTNILKKKLYDKKKNINFTHINNFIIFSYFLVDFLIVKITLIQFLGIELINLTLNYLQDIHKKKLLKA